MSEQLHVIALISGGKDSLYSILHCLDNGHKIVALANLYPKSPQISSTPDENLHESADKSKFIEEQEEEDLNSFMYQTVGHSVIPIYAEALGLPLYRREITGTAIVTDRYYSRANAYNAGLDETEDLIPLLTTVKKAHPSANAISTGAIQSTYQRTRVESVALRLGLVPLGYLWQYPILPPPVSREDSLTGLLEDMEAAGCEARIIKIASGGINANQLWADVSNSKTRHALVRGLRMFFADDETGLRSAVVGEGGEFETLALSGPRRLWKNGRIAVDCDIGRSWTGDGGTSYARIGRARLLPHDAQSDKGTVQEELLRMPALLDMRFQFVQDQLERGREGEGEGKLGAPLVASHFRNHAISEALHPQTSYLINSTTVQINNLTAVSTEPAHSNPLSPTAQMESIALSLSQTLRRISSKHTISPPLESTDIVHAILLLRTMDTFGQVNPIYARMFPADVPNPPARVTVAAALPQGVDISLSVVIDRGRRIQRRGLHVQGRSYWAPANIGPYSQAVCTFMDPERTEAEGNSMQVVHVAGQIPLVPSNMKNHVGNFTKQATLALQHLWRVGQEREVDTWTAGVAFLARNAEGCVPGDAQDEWLLRNVDIAADAWRRTHCVLNNGDHVQSTTARQEHQDDNFDVWDIHNNRASISLLDNAFATKNQHLHTLPLPTIDTFGMRSTIIPPFFAAEVTALPRNVSIEWWSTGVAGLAAKQSNPDPKVLFSLTNSSHADGFRSELTFMCVDKTSKKRTKFVVSAIFESNRDPRDQRTDPLLSTPEVNEFFQSGSSAPIGAVTNGIAFATAGALAQYNINHEQRGAVSEPKLQPKSLFERLTVIPCHNIWARAGECVQHDQPRSDQSTERIAKVCVAMFLRIDAQK